MCSLECKKIHLERVHYQQKIENGELLVASCDGNNCYAVSRIRYHIFELEGGCILSVLHMEQSLYKHRCSVAIALECRLLKYEEGCISQSVVNFITPVSAAHFIES